jgi:chaperonin GroES
MKFRPLHDRVLLERLEEPDSKTLGGIIIPDSAAKEKPMKGKVIAVGSGVLR